MADFLQQFRRNATQFTIRHAIIASATLPIGLQRSIVRSLIALAGGIPMLRWRVRENMRLALGHDVPAQAASANIFAIMGWFQSSALSTFHYGIGATPVPKRSSSMNRSVSLMKLSPKDAVLSLLRPIGRAMRLWPRSSAADTQ